MEEFEKFGVLLKPEGAKMVKEAGAAIVLMANQPPHYFDREAGGLVITNKHTGRR